MHCILSTTHEVDDCIGVGDDDNDTDDERMEIGIGSNPITRASIHPPDSSYCALFIPVFTTLYLYISTMQLYSCSLFMCVFTFVFKLTLCPHCNRRVVFNVPAPCSPSVQTPICYILNFQSAYKHHHHLHFTTFCLSDWM